MKQLSNPVLKTVEVPMLVKVRIGLTKLELEMFNKGGDALRQRVFERVHGRIEEQIKHGQYSWYFSNLTETLLEAGLVVE